MRRLYLTFASRVLHEVPLKMIGEPGAMRACVRAVRPPVFAIVAIVVLDTTGVFARSSEDRGPFLGSFDEFRMSGSLLNAVLGSFSRSFLSRSSPIAVGFVRAILSRGRDPGAGFVFEKCRDRGFVSFAGFGR